MKIFYKQILIFLLIIILTVTLGKNIYEAYRSVNEYPKVGCNGNSFDRCVKANGIDWCRKNCRNATAKTRCKNQYSGSNMTATWGDCFKYQSKTWCQNNCTDASGVKYAKGITNM
jgi:hypothetical protein